VRAIRFTRHGAYDELHAETMEPPVRRPDEIVLRMAAAAVTALDHSVRAGRVPGAAPAPLTPGVEGVGYVEPPGTAEAPAGMRAIVTLGGRGFGLYEDGTWREYLAVHPKDLITVPETLSDFEAAGLIHEYVPAQTALLLAAVDLRGTTVVTPTLMPGVGDAMAQLAQCAGATRVILPARTAALAQRIREAGYTDVIDCTRETLDEGVLRLTGGAGADVILDGLGGPATDRAVSRGGALVRLGRSSERGAAAAPDVRLVEVDVTGAPHAVVNAALRSVRDLVGTGQIRPRVARVFPLEDAAMAQRHVIEDEPFGRVVLDIRGAGRRRD